MFYTTAVHSPTHAEFCERVFGRNLCQHGFADMLQVEALIEVLQLQPGLRVLEIGCGNGMITEYISDSTGAHLTGLDYMPQAVSQAQERTAFKADRLSFTVGNINDLQLSKHSFDAAISIDSIYFSNDFTRTIRQLIEAVRPDGSLIFLYSHGREPWVSREDFPAESILPERTPLAAALRANGLCFHTRDFSRDDYRIAQLRLQVLPELRSRFEADGILSVYENRMGDARGMSQAYEDGLHARYLYHSHLPAKD